MLKQIGAQLSEMKIKIYLAMIFFLSALHVIIMVDNDSFVRVLSSIIIQFIGSIALGVILILPFAVFDKKIRNRVLSKILIASLILTSIYMSIDIIVLVMHL
jgi:hypothetical protein